MDSCYVTSPRLHKHQAQGTDHRDNGKQHTLATHVQPKMAHTTQYIVVNDNRPKKPNSFGLAQQHVSWAEVWPLRPVSIEDASTDVNISVSNVGLMRLIWLTNIGLMLLILILWLILILFKDVLMMYILYRWILLLVERIVILEGVCRLLDFLHPND